MRQVVGGLKAKGAKRADEPTVVTLITFGAAPLAFRASATTPEAAAMPAPPGSGQPPSGMPQGQPRF